MAKKPFLYDIDMYMDNVYPYAVIYTFMNM